MTATPLIFMAATPLIVGEAQRQALHKLRALAAANPLDMPTVMERLKTRAGTAAHMRQMTKQTIDIPLAFSVTFSIEVGHPVGTCRHMSMSSDRTGRLPTPEAVWMIAEELGFVDSLAACHFWFEDVQGGASSKRKQAVSLVQPLATLTPSAA
jgi:hypothetical protein